MPEARKRPCRICRRWFRPGPRAGDRQRACDAAECQAARRQKTQARWRKRNPGYAAAWRIDRRATHLPQPPEPQRLPAPLNQLPWDVAKDHFGVQGADFIGVMSSLIIRVAKDHFKAYLIDPTGLSGRLPPPPEKTSPGGEHTETRTAIHATGVSPTGPAMGAFASPRTAPAAPVAGVAGCRRLSYTHRRGGRRRPTRPLSGHRPLQPHRGAPTTRPGYGESAGVAD